MLRAEVLELLKNPEFLEKVMEENNKEKLKKLFLEKGVSLNVEELDNVGKEIYDSLVLASKLSEGETESVSGGGKDKKIESVSSVGFWDWCKKKVGLPTSEQEQALHDNMAENVKLYQEAETPDTWFDIADRNKGKLAVGAVAVTLCAIYGVKNIKRYLNKSRKKKIG